MQQSARGYQNYQQWVTGTQLEQKISLEDYSVSNRGLRSGLVGTPQQVKERVAAFQRSRSGPAAAAVQPAARGDGALRGRGDDEPKALQPAGSPASPAVLQR